STSVVINLHFESGIDGAPSRIFADSSTFGICALPQGNWQTREWIAKPDKHAAIAVRRIENPELQPQMKVVERLGRVIEQRKNPCSIGRNLTIDERKALPAVGSTHHLPFLKSSDNPVKQCRKS